MTIDDDDKETAESNKQLDNGLRAAITASTTNFGHLYPAFISLIAFNA